MLAVKSKAEDTEKVRPWPLVGRPPTAGFPASRGSSCSRESFRDEDMLGRESVSASSFRWSELASEASSRESRVCAWRFEYEGGMMKEGFGPVEGGRRLLRLWFSDLRVPISSNYVSPYTDLTIFETKAQARVENALVVDWRRSGLGRTGDGSCIGDGRAGYSGLSCIDRGRYCGSKDWQ